MVPVILTQSNISVPVVPVITEAPEQHNILYSKVENEIQKQWPGMKYL